MKQTQPICLVIENENDSTSDIRLFGWSLNKEKAVIEIAENSNMKIELAVPNHGCKDIMMDLITRPQVMHLQK